MSTLKIDVISLAGTDSRLAIFDLGLAKVIKEVLESLGVGADIRMMDLSIARHQCDRGMLDQIFPIYRDLGCEMSPACFLNGELLFHGRVPGAEEFKAFITDRFDIVDEPDA